MSVAEGHIIQLTLIPCYVKSLYDLTFEVIPCMHVRM